MKHSFSAGIDNIVRWLKQDHEYVFGIIGIREDATVF
jgi:hypothetical protein